MPREILNRNPDKEVLFKELHDGGQRDVTGLQLGAVTRHYEGRLLVSYQVLRLFEGLRDMGVFPRGTTVRHIGHPPQDKQVSGTEQAAHRLPTDLSVTLPSGASERVYNVFQNPFSKGWIKDNLFARTDRVHRFTNKADSDCESHGMRDALPQACGAVINGNNVNALEVFEGRLLTDYAAAIQSAIQFNRAELLRTPVMPADGRVVDMHGQVASPTRADLIQREADRRPILDRFGHAANARSADLSLNSSNDDARIANRRSVIDVLQIYAGVALSPRHLLGQATAEVEQMLRMEIDYRR
jgi:hypothetical protein